MNQATRNSNAEVVINVFIATPAHHTVLPHWQAERTLYISINCTLNTDVT